MNEEQIQEMIENGQIEFVEEGENGIENTQTITFSEEIISSYESVSEPVEEEYRKGVKEASKYIGQFHSLINAGLDSETAIVIMSWIKDDKLNTDAIKMQIEVAKQEGVKQKREIL